MRVQAWSKAARLALALVSWSLVTGAAHAASVSCSGVAAWTDCCSCTYSLNQQVTYGGSRYHAAQAFTNTCGAGWTPSSTAALWTLDGTCSVSATATKTATKTATATTTKTPTGTARSTTTKTSTATATRTPTATATSGSGFRHPGVLVNKAQLDFVKSKIAAGAQPWKAAFDKANGDSHGSLTYTAHPWTTVECGPSSNPNYGCSDERSDAEAAYTHALLWYFTGNSAHANKAVEIMNAWSATITGHTNSNTKLQTGWAGSMWAPAAEIMRMYSGWASSDVSRFKTMLKNIYLPVVLQTACENGNWEAVMTNASIGIAVFLDDRTSFNTALGFWRNRTPAYMYETTDGSLPKQTVPNCGRDTASELISFWQGQSTFVNGLAQETCRDFGHTEWGLAASVDSAETARQQGVDLYGEQSKRIRDAWEFHANYVMGASVPSWLCGGTVSLSTIPTWEIVYNHYHNRLGLSMPKTEAVILQKARPTGINYFIAWETLTHAGVGSVGLP